MSNSSNHIEITQGVAGGKPRIAGHRITVQDIVIWHENLGRTADEIASEHSITLADVYAALAYYYDHRDEIQESIQREAALVEEIRKQNPSSLKQKLGV